MKSKGQDTVATTIIDDYTCPIYLLYLPRMTYDSLQGPGSNLEK